MILFNVPSLLAAFYGRKERVSTNNVSVVVALPDLEHACCTEKAKGDDASSFVSSVYSSKVSEDSRT